MTTASFRWLAKAAALVAIVAAALLPASVHAQATGRIDGQVTNGTAGAPPPADVAVTIHIFKDRARIGEQVTRTDASGRFTAENLETGPGFVYFPVVDHGGAAYFPAQPISLEQSPQQTAEIRIYEPTSSDETISFDRSNLLILRVTPTTLTLMEMGAVLNSGDRTYVGGAPGEGTLRFVVPPGAAEITPQAGFPPNGVVETPDGFATSSAVVPGRHELAFSYQLPYDSATLDLVKRQSYPTATFNLYVPDTGLSIISTGLLYQGTSELGGQRYQLYTAQGLARGAELQIRLGNLPAPWGPKHGQLAIIVAAVCSLALAGAGLYAVYQRRDILAPASPSPIRDRPTDHERLSLIRSLAELDERFEAGDIDENRYRQEREHDKARLIAIGTSRD